VADLLDLSEMNLSAKIGEMDRANLREGQEMTFQLDSVPDKRFPGKIKTLSGTASADVFSGDPSKKFDVTFTIDMRAMLGGLGMKSGDVDRIMSEAAANAAKNLVSMAPTVGGGGRGGGGGPPPDMGAAMDPTLLAAMRSQMAGQAGQAGQGRAQAAGPGDAQGRGRGGSPPALTAADRQKLADIGKQLLTATGDEREKLQAQMQALMPQTASRGRGGQGRGQGGFGGGDMAGGQGRGQGGPGGAMAGGQGRGQGGPGGGQGRGQGGQGQMFGGFTDADRANAKLPPPPDQDTDVSKLLRPGLLADVEIEVERIPNAIHVPQQAIFQKGGQPTVYVQQANGRFVPRVVKLAKESETTMVLESGVEPGEIVALADPTVNKSEKNKTDETKKGASATSMMPGGK
jgi:hypothetical protein